MSSQQKMWRFDYSNKAAVVPEIVPDGTNAGTIDVVNNFAWTKNAFGTSDDRFSARRNCPKIKLTERKITVNALYTQLAYQFDAFGGGVASLPGDLASSAKKVVDSVGKTESAEFKSFSDNLGTLANALQTSGSKVQGIISDTISSVVGNDISNIVRNDVFKNKELKPYQNLYISQRTGFNYILPYNIDIGYNVNSSFDEPGAHSAGFIGDVIEGAGSILKKFTMANASPFKYKYMENSKQFNFEGTPESFEIKFPLLNTGTYEDIFNNWKFIYLLTYQNTPARRDKSNVEPPCIYEVDIPGVKYYPYAYISSLRVDMLGNKKRYVLEGVFNSEGTTDQNQNITTIIPEVYMVTIRVDALIQQTKNILYSPLMGEKSVINTDVDGIKSLFKSVTLDPKTFGQTDLTQGRNVSNIG